MHHGRVLTLSRLTLSRVPVVAMLNGLGLGHLLPTFEAEELGLPLLQKMAEDPAECAMVLDEVGVGICSTGLPFLLCAPLSLPFGC